MTIATGVIAVVVLARGWGGFQSVATRFGLPMSTARVSVGALAGLCWTDTLTPARAEVPRPISHGWALTRPMAAGSPAGRAW